MPISDLAVIGVAVESTWGAGGSPAVVFPVETWNLQDPYEQILDNAKRGQIARDYQAYQGIGRAEASMEGNVFPDLFGYLLKPIFGSLSTAGTTAPYTHTFTFSGSPPSLALTQDDTITKYEGRGLMASELGLSFSPTDGALSYSSSFVGKDFATASYTFPSDVQEDTPFLLGWQGSIQLDGAWFKVVEGEMTISREVALHYQLNNTQYAGTAYASAPEITGSFQIDYTAAGDYDRYRNHSSGSINMYWQYDANRTLRMVMGSVNFGDGPIEMDKSGASITLGYTWRALYDSDEGGPAKATLVSNTATY